MATAGDPLTLISLLHAAAIDASKWNDFLRELSAQTSSVTGAVLSQPPRSLELDAVALGGLDPHPDAQRAYNIRFAKHDPFYKAALGSAPTGIVSDTELVPRDLLRRGAFYNEFMQPYRMEHGVMLPMMGQRGTDLISLWRTPQQGPMAAEHLQLLTSLLPHLRFAFTVRRNLDQLNLRLDCLRSMFHAVSAPALLLDLKGRLVLMSSAAEAILRENDGISLHRSGLRLTTPKAQSKYECLVRACAAPADLHEGQWRGVLIPRPSGRCDLQALVTPVVSPDPSSSSVTHILVVLRDPSWTDEISASLLGDLFGFSFAEAAIANALLEGLSLEQISLRRHVSCGTVRNQMKSILSKSGTRSQVDLLRILGTLPRDRRSRDLL